VGSSLLSLLKDPFTEPIKSRIRYTKYIKLIRGSHTLNSIPIDSSIIKDVLVIETWLGYATDNHPLPIVYQDISMIEFLDYDGEILLNAEVSINTSSNDVKQYKGTKWYYTEL